MTPTTHDKKYIVNLLFKWCFVFNKLNVFTYVLNSWYFETYALRKQHPILYYAKILVKIPRYRSHPAGPNKDDTNATYKTTDVQTNKTNCHRRITLKWSVGKQLLCVCLKSDATPIYKFMFGPHRGPLSMKLFSWTCFTKIPKALYWFHLTSSFYKRLGNGSRCSECLIHSCFIWHMTESVLKLCTFIPDQRISVFFFYVMSLKFNDMYQKDIQLEFCHSDSSIITKTCLFK